MSFGWGSLNRQQHPHPLPQRLSPLLEVRVPVINPLHPRQLVVQAHLRDVARHAQRAQVRLHGAAQVVRRESAHRRPGGAQPVVDGLAQRVLVQVGVAAMPGRATA